MNDESQFKKYKSTLQKLYSDERTLIGATGGRKSYYNVNRLKGRAEVLLDIESSLNDPNKASQMSETLMGVNGIYAEIIQYFVNMPLYRYTVIPSLMKKERAGVDPGGKYADSYNKIMAAVDGISISVTFPKILQWGLTHGVVYLYVDKDTSSSTVETIILPNSYCKRGFVTSFGSDTVILDFKFFDDLKSNFGSTSGLVIDEEMFEELFPATLIKQYNDYKKDSTLRYQLLEPKFSAAISFSPAGVPPKLYAHFGIVDYEVIKTNEIQRSLNELEKVLVHQIPNHDGELIFDIEEAFEIHESMALAVKGVKGLKLLTTFGQTELLELQKERTKENKSMEQAYHGIYHSAGLNPFVFNGDSKESIDVSIKKDSAYVFKQLELIINFYNIAINNLYSFTPYQAKINMLPITIYDEAEKIQMYRENAEFGIGKLEAVVAAGIRQVDIQDKHSLEAYLDLENILVPLQSSHTSTPEDKKPQSEEPKVKEDKEKGTDEVDTNE